jgi:hypothetical protein
MTEAMGMCDTGENVKRRDGEALNINITVQLSRGTQLGPDNGHSINIRVL